MFIFCMLLNGFAAYAEEGMVSIRFKTISPTKPAETTGSSGGGNTSSDDNNDNDDYDDYIFTTGKEIEDERNENENQLVTLPNLGELPKTGSNGRLISQLAVTNYFMLVIIAWPRRRRKNLKHKI